MNSKQVVIFGTGSGAREYISSSVDHNNILYFVDNDESKWNSLFFGKQVCPPHTLTSLPIDVDVLIASSYVSEIREQLLSFGFLSKILLSHLRTNTTIFISYLCFSFNELNHLNIRYLVLRNFQDLPHLQVAILIF